MSKRYRSSLAICPYYRGETPQMIYCGDNDEGNPVYHIAFANRTDAYMAKRKSCRCKPKTCKMFRMLSEER